MPARPREERVRFGSHRTRLLEVDGRDPAVVLIHGWSDSADCWRAVMERLGRAGVRAVAADMPGHGEAGSLREGRPGTQWLDVARRVVAAHRAAGTIVSGYSLGGRIALLLAQDDRAPDLRGVVPMSPPGLEGPWWLEALGCTAPAARLALSLPAPVPTPVVHRLTREIYARTGVSNRAALTGDVVSRYTGYWGDRATVRERLRVSLDLIEELAEPIEFDRIEVPVLLLWGRDDRVLPSRATEVLKRGKPDARVAVLDDCGHILPLDAPEVVADHLIDFHAAVTDRPSPPGRRARGSARPSTSCSGRA